MYCANLLINSQAFIKNPKSWYRLSHNMREEFLTVAPQFRDSCIHVGLEVQAKYGEHIAKEIEKIKSGLKAGDGTEDAVMKDATAITGQSSKNGGSNDNGEAKDDTIKESGAEESNANKDEPSKDNRTEESVANKLEPSDNNEAGESEAVKDVSSEAGHDATTTTNDNAVSNGTTETPTMTEAEAKALRKKLYASNGEPKFNTVTGEVLGRPEQLDQFGYKIGFNEIGRNIADGRFEPSWIIKGELARLKRKEGAFDQYKEDMYEEYWGQKQRVQYDAIAGESAKIKFETLALAPTLFKEGDIWTYRRTFKVEGAPKGRVFVEKEAKLTAIDRGVKPPKLTFIISPGQKFSIASNAANDPATYITIANVINPQILCTRIVQNDGRIATIPNGNAWKEIRTYRDNQDMGALWDVRELYYVRGEQAKAKALTAKAMEMYPAKGKKVSGGGGEKGPKKRKEKDSVEKDEGEGKGEAEGREAEEEKTAPTVMTRSGRAVKQRRI